MKIFWTKEKAWQCDGTIARKRIRQHGFATKKSLEEFIVELKMQARRGKYGLRRERPHVLLRELVEERISDLNPKEHNERACIAILRQFANQFPPGFSVDELTTVHLRAFVKERQRVATIELGRKLKPGTINKDLMTISGMLRRAPDMFSELGDDWRTPRIPWEKVSRRGNERIITSTERRVVLEGLRLGGVTKAGGRLGARYIEARRDAADIFELAFHTGMRGAEACGLTWSAVDLDAGEIHLSRTKNKNPRDIPCNRRALEILSRRYEKRRFSQWVFSNRKGTGPRSRESYRQLVAKVAVKLGLRYGRALEDGFTPHATRHTTATEMMRAGKSPKDVQEILGHSNQTMALRYMHAHRAGMRDAVDSLVDQKTGNRSTAARQKVDSKNSDDAAKQG